MSPLRPWALATILVAAFACGETTAPERNKPGTGTNTLKVTADIDADDVTGGFSTDFDVVVRDGSGNAVSGATVTISNSDLGTLSLVETGAGSGDYQATRSVFPAGDFALSVVRGSDNIKDVVVGGPGGHAITEPKASTPVPALQPLTIKWTAPLKAKSAEVETRNFNAVTLPDTGAFVVPGAQNPARPDQRVRVWRFNEVDIAGGLPGSRFRVKVRQTIEPVIVQ